MSGKRKLRVSPFGLSAEYQRPINKAVPDGAAQLRCAAGPRGIRSPRQSLCRVPHAVKCRSSIGSLQDLLHVTGSAPEDAELDGLFKPELLH
jgi:hypothetical protein